MKQYALNFIIICLTLSANATMILPYDDLGQLTEIADDIVIVEVKQDLFQLSHELNNYSWELEIKKSFKGEFQIDQRFTMHGMSSKSENLFNYILGDLNFKVGKTYLLFLDHTENNTWQPICLSFYNYSLETISDEEYWVPTKEAIGMCMWKDSDPLFVLNKEEMEKQLSNYIVNDFNYNWVDNKVKSSISLSDFHPSLRTPPSSCTFLFDNSNCYGTSFDGVRWQAFPQNPVEVWLDTEQQTGIDSEQICDDAISEMNANYAGINLPFEGIASTNFTPNCPAPSFSAKSGNFTSYSNGLNGGDNILTIFNDPCGEISDLNNCAGILAVGGLYGFCWQGGASANDNHDNLSWFQATNGYVIVNNGAECLSDSDFEIMMTHEYTHALGLGHIASSNGNANMNPTCCNSISSLDTDCADYLYPAATTVPVNWLDFMVSEEHHSNLIEWSTATEINNDHFVIEYSKASYDLRIWKELRIVKGNGNTSSPSKYSYSDNINLGPQTYYRIKQVDVNGHSSYSEIISIQRKIEKTEINLYPNPATDLLNLVGNMENTSVILMDGLGKQVRADILSSTEHLTRIDISQLQNGIYYIKIGNKIDNSVHTFIKH